MAMYDLGIKATWVEALRSGKFKQGQGLLIIEEENDCPSFYHCCLGVLCEVMGIPRDNDDRTEESLVDGFLFTAKPGVQRHMSDLLDGDLLNILGITHNQQDTLTHMNDGGADNTGAKPMTFAEIADWIETNL